MWPAQYAEIDAQQLQVKLRHEPRSAADAIEADYAAAARAKPGRRPLDFEVRCRAFVGSKSLLGWTGNGNQTALPCIEADYAAAARAKPGRRLLEFEVRYLFWAGAGVDRTWLQDAF